MASPLVSCIVPVFNGERYLREALDSIFPPDGREPRAAGEELDRGTAIPSRKGHVELCPRARYDALSKLSRTGIRGCISNRILWRV